MQQERRNRPPLFSFSQIGATAQNADLLFCNSIAFSILQRQKSERNTVLCTEFFQKRYRFVNLHSMIVDIVIRRMNQEISTIV